MGRLSKLYNFITKLNKKSTPYCISDEVITLTDGKWEGFLNHDNVNAETIEIYTSTNRSGSKVLNYTVVPTDETWRTYVRVFHSANTLYVTYETTGDTVEADDINNLQLAIDTLDVELEGTTNNLKDHVSNSEIHIASAERTAWNEKVEKVDLELTNELLNDHKNNKMNPHGVTKEQLQLERVDNVQQASKEEFDNHVSDTVLHITTSERNSWNTVSNKLAGIAENATKTEASTTNGKIKINGTETTVYTHPTGTNPHGTTKADVGLGNVDNTSDLNKPISTAVQTALNGKANSSHTHDYLPLSGGTVSGSTVFTQGTRIHCADASGGTSGYLHVAQIKITASYTNQPIMISFVQRGQAQINTVEIAFANSTSTDPSLSAFVKTGSANVYIYKSETSTWDLYIKKTESYDNIEIIDFKKGSHMGGLTITWKNALVASVPTGYTTASTKSIITNISGNASTATKLQTARTITIGSKGKTFDGSANVSFTIDEIGALPTTGITWNDLKGV